MKNALIRLGRVALAAAVAAVIADQSHQPYWFIVGPIINAIGKYLRDKYQLDWLPF